MTTISSLEGWYAFWQAATLIALAATFVTGVGTFLTGKWLNEKQSIENKALGVQVALAGEAAAKANKEAAEARLELAKIDPVNLPITSIRADVFLLVKASFPEWYFDRNNPVTKGGAGHVGFSLENKEGSLVSLECTHCESMSASTDNKEGFNKRTFSMTFEWPTTSWFGAMVRDKHRTPRDNPSTATLDKELTGVLISLPPSDEDLKTNTGRVPAEILQSECFITINGSIRRHFSVPPSSFLGNIFCPVKHE